MMKKITKSILLLLSFFFLGNVSLQAQEPINWSYLADVEFEEKFSVELGYKLHHATFGKMVSELEDQEVTIEGYMIPMDPMGITYVLSKNPNSSCFFCGGAGPETVLELELKASAIRRYEVDDLKKFKGVLKMNKVNDKQLTYVLKEAEPVD
jgi:hypothetical protein